MKIYSLYKAALLHLALPLIFAVSIAVASTLWFTHKEVEKLYNAQMVQMANMLLVLVKHEAIEGEDIRQTLGSDTDSIQAFRDPFIAYRIWNGDTLILQSTEAEILGKQANVDGFSEVVANGDEWYIYKLRDKGGEISVEVVQKCWPRRILLWEIVRALSLPLLILITALFYIVFSSLKNTIAPLDSLSREVDIRSANDLSPLTPRKIPVEIFSLFIALNNLFLRLSESIQRERDFTDNAAHELRTPLAALKTRAQVFAKQVKNDPMLAEGMGDLLATVNRTVGVVDQLLSFTRLQTDELAFEMIDLSTLIGNVVTDLAPQTVAKNQNMDADIEDNITVTGHAGALRILARNLIDNAIRYTPPEGDIHIALEKQGDKIVFCVSDTGQGIKSEDRERVFERFTRLDTEQTGSGLGLSIVKWICDAHGAVVTLRQNEPKGLIAEVLLPP